MRRNLKGKWLIAVKLIAIAFAAFHILTAGFGQLPDMQQRVVHVAFGLVLTLALTSATKRPTLEKSIPIWDVVLILLVIASCANAYFGYERFIFAKGESTPYDLVLGAVIILLVVESGRRVVGWTFPILVVVFILYAIFGAYMPGPISHPGVRPVYLIQSLYQSTLGVWGFITGISATQIAILIVLGGFLLVSGGAQTFIDIALKVAGRYKGGPGLAAVIGSALFGTISGGAVVNVMAVGNLTIPLMKRLGYRPEFAGGVEATASTGGQIMPPIMGSGAFIMAELLGISYANVMVAALLPAILYFLAVGCGVRFEAMRRNLPPVPRDEIPPLRSFLTWGKLAPLVIPIAALLIAFGIGRSVGTAVFWALILAVILHVFADPSPSQMWLRTKGLVPILERCGKSIVEIVSLMVCSAIVVHLISLTGLAIVFSNFIMTLSGSSIILALILAALIVLILGTGLPTTAAYVLAAAVVAPAIVKMGVFPLSAHLFLFYYACLSSITPPVCLACFAAAAIAGTGWTAVAWIALRLGLTAFLVPFVFVYQPALLMIGQPWLIMLLSIIAILAVIVLSAGLFGYLNMVLHPATRVGLVLAAGLLFYPAWQTCVGGIGVVVITLISQRMFISLRRIKS